MAEMVTIYTKRGVASGAGKYVPLGGANLGQLTAGNVITALATPLVIAGGALAVTFWIIHEMGKTVRGTSGLRGMTPQQGRFKAAAKACKGRNRASFQACMSDRLVK